MNALSAGLAAVGVVGILVGVLMGFGTLPGAAPAIGGGHTNPPVPNMGLSLVAWAASGSTVDLWANGTASQVSSPIYVAITVGSAVSGGRVSVNSGSFSYHVRSTLSTGTYAVSSNASATANFGQIHSLTAKSSAVTLKVTTSGITAGGSLVAQFHETQAAGTLTVVFTDASVGLNGVSPNPGATQWIFSDGWQSVGGTVTHTFAAAGTYSATETITGSSSSGTVSNTSSQSFVVWPISCFNCPLGLSVRFWWTTANLSASLTDHSVVMNGTLTSENWSFGDGTFGAGPSATHLYAKAGSYNVTETVVATGIVTGSSTQSFTAVVTVAIGTTSTGCSIGSICSFPPFVLGIGNGAVLGLSFGLIGAAIAQSPWRKVGVVTVLTLIGVVVGFLI